MTNYDPDLIPIFTRLDAADADLEQRVTALESKPAPQMPDLTALDNRLTAIEKVVADIAAAVAGHHPQEPDPVDPLEPDPVDPPPASAAPIWETLQGPRVSIPNEIRVPTGQSEIWVPVTADSTARQTFYADVSGFANMSGGGVNVGSVASQRRDFGNWDGKLYIWSPGDDPTHYIKVTTAKQFAHGQFFRLMVRTRNLGDSQKGKGVTIIFDDNATIPDMPPQFHRPLRRLDLSNAARKNTFDPATVRWSDSGFDQDGKPVWRSRLAHGYSQDGNQETGLYMSEEIWPEKAQNPISYDSDEKAIRLHTVAFPDDAWAVDPLNANRKSYPHQAAVLQGQRMDEVCGVAGVWRMEAKIPIRKGAWPAFWLIGRSDAGSKGQWAKWPPEIDILEKFNFAWGGADTPFTSTFAQHYGKVGSNSRKGAFGGVVELNEWLGATNPVDEEYHSWAAAVIYDENDPLKSEVTFFVDDVEVGTHVLFARHEDMKTKVEFFPIFNVAVKVNSSRTPESYNTDEGRNRTGDMLVRDVAYYPAGFTFSPVTEA